MPVNISASSGERDSPASHIRLVVTYMDGTLLTPEKQITPRSIETISALHAAGVPVCLVSSRPPAGIEMYLDAIGLTTPYGALNGASVFNADRSIHTQLTLPPDVISDTLDMFNVHHLDTWLFRGHDWLIKNSAGPYVATEKRVIRQEPVIVDNFAEHMSGIGKVTGSSTDYTMMHDQELEIGRLMEGRASVARSSQWYLDVTPLNANKGYALCKIAEMYGVAPHEVACIGDMNNDLPMFDKAGLAIAMGQTSPEVMAQAHYITASNSQEGWAEAMRTLVLPRAVSVEQKQS